MVRVTANVNNGVATVSTSGNLNWGNYSVIGYYLENDEFKSSSDTADLFVDNDLSYDIFDYNQWVELPISSFANPVAPSYDSSGYDMGRYYNNVNIEFKIIKELTNTVIDISVITQSVKQWAIGLVQYENNTFSSSHRNYFTSTQDNAQLGLNVVTFECDENGVWSVLLNDSDTSTSSFTLNEDRYLFCRNDNVNHSVITDINMYPLI